MKLKKLIPDYSVESLFNSMKNKIEYDTTHCKDKILLKKELRDCARFGYGKVQKRNLDLGYCSKEAKNATKTTKDHIWRPQHCYEAMISPQLRDKYFFSKNSYDLFYEVTQLLPQVVTVCSEEHSKFSNQIKRDRNTFEKKLYCHAKDIYKVNNVKLWNVDQNKYMPKDFFPGYLPEYFEKDLHDYEKTIIVES